MLITLFNKIKSPYLEYDYIVKNSDTIENILKKFSVKKEEIAFVVKEIKKFREMESIKRTLQRRPDLFHGRDIN